MKNSNDTIGNQNYDLLACSAVIYIYIYVAGMWYHFTVIIHCGTFKIYLHLYNLLVSVMCPHKTLLQLTDSCIRISVLCAYAWTVRHLIELFGCCGWQGFSRRKVSAVLKRATLYNTLLSKRNFQFAEIILTFVGRLAQSVQRLATGRTVPGSNPRGGEIFPHLSRPALGPTQPPVQWVLGLYQV